MDEFDFVIIGSGAAGEAAAHEARRRGASVAVVARELVGGSCPFWACMPSKALRTLCGAFVGGPGASEAIHMAVPAIKARTPVEILADTMTAFPTTTRVMGGLFVRAAHELGWRS